jgi:hypothetical protein
MLKKTERIRHTVAFSFSSPAFFRNLLGAKRPPPCLLSGDGQ